MSFTRLQAPAHASGSRPKGDVIKLTVSKRLGTLLSVRQEELAELFRLKKPEDAEYRIELGEGEDAGVLRLVCDAGGGFTGRPMRGSLVFRLGKLPLHDGKEGSAWCPYRFIKPYTFVLELPDWAV